MLSKDRIRVGRTEQRHASLTSFQEGPHAFHDAPEFIFAFEHIMNMPIEFVSTGGVNRSAVNVCLSTGRGKINNWLAREKRDGWAEGGY